jgi:hypothetical protein
LNRAHRGLGADPLADGGDCTQVARPANPRALGRSSTGLRGLRALSLGYGPVGQICPRGGPSAPALSTQSSGLDRATRERDLRPADGTERNALIRSAPVWLSHPKGLREDLRPAQAPKNSV